MEIRFKILLLLIEANAFVELNRAIIAQTFDR